MSAWGQAAKSCNALLTRIEHHDPTLVDLVILPSKTFGDTELDRLSKALLSPNCVLESISASGHYVSPDALRRFGKAIVQSSLLRKIAIGDTHMGDDGVIALCEGLNDTTTGSSTSRTSTLQHIDLEYKSISVEGMKALGQTLLNPDNNHNQHPVVYLNLARNDTIGDEGILQFCSNSNSSENDTTTTTTTFSFFHNLQTLDLSECNIGSHGIQTLSKCFQTQCETNKNNDDDTTTTSVSGRLNLLLNSNPIGPLGFESLFWGSTTTTTTTTPPTSRPLHHGVFSSLLVQNCQVGDEGILRLVKTIQQQQQQDENESSVHCRNGLEILDLSNNQIGPLGIQAFAETLKGRTATAATPYWTNLSDIRLAGNPLEVEGVKSFVQALHQRKDRVNDTADGEEDGTTKNTTVKSLDLCQTNAGKEGAAAALCCGSLTSLRLFNNKLGIQQGFQFLAPYLCGGHPSLINLDLGGNNETEENVIHLLESIKNTSGASFVEQKSSALRVLELGGNEGGDAVEALVKELKHLQPELDIARDRPRKDPNE